MLQSNITIINKLGLHARAAAKMVQTASRFSADVKLIRDHREVNAKSIMGVMMLAAAKGTELTLRVEGSDENEALQAVQDLVADRFGEDE